MKNPWCKEQIIFDPGHKHICSRVFLSRSVLGNLISIMSYCLKRFIRRTICISGLFLTRPICSPTFWSQYVGLNSHRFCFRLSI
jgi:hypothetical protein